MAAINRLESCSPAPAPIATLPASNGTGKTTSRIALSAIHQGWSRYPSSFILGQGVSRRMLRPQSPDWSRHDWKGVLWSPSYVAACCGEAPSNILKGYLEQQKTALEQSLCPRPERRSFTELAITDVGINPQLTSDGEEGRKKHVRNRNRTPAHGDQSEFQQYSREQGERQ